MEIWEPDSGAVVTLLPRGKDGRPSIDPASLVRITLVDAGLKFFESMDVRISIDGEPGDDAELRYTLDGSDPATDSLLYSDPISISETTPVRAAIFKAGKAITSIEEATYTRQQG
jgi:hypothetical protein